MPNSDSARGVASRIVLWLAPPGTLLAKVVVPFTAPVALYVFSQWPPTRFCPGVHICSSTYSEPLRAAEPG